MTQEAMVISLKKEWNDETYLNVKESLGGLITKIASKWSYKFNGRFSREELISLADEVLLRTIEKWRAGESSKVITYFYLAYDNEIKDYVKKLTMNLIEDEAVSKVKIEKDEFMNDLFLEKQKRLASYIKKVKEVFTVNSQEYKIISKLYFSLVSLEKTNLSVIAKELNIKDIYGVVARIRKQCGC
ncbi:MAG: hypothetical protein WC942_09765 [Clostridia bacterium]|jgi:hypothetical protein